MTSEPISIAALAKELKVPRGDVEVLVDQLVGIDGSADVLVDYHDETGASAVDKWTGSPLVQGTAAETIREQIRGRPLPPDQHEGAVRESDDGHVFTGWCSCGWEGEDHDAGTLARSDEKHTEAYDQAYLDLNRHHDEAVSAWLKYLQEPEEQA